MGKVSGTNIGADECINCLNATAQRNGEGIYQINLSNSPGDANYIINLTVSSQGQNDSGCDRDDVNITYYGQAANQFFVRVITGDDGATIDEECDREFMFTVFDPTP